MDKNYTPELFEPELYKFWLKENFFVSNPDKREPYSIVMPPLNVTGKAHIGHALDNTIQDVLIRYKRMLGYNALWLPGTDHAAIATEQVLVRDLKRNGLTKEEIGREEFLKRGWDWYRNYTHVICDQLKKLGISCDWSKLAFTMDEVRSRAVKHVFCEYYKQGLIYRGKRVVNYCPSCKTTISDNENIHIDQNTYLWYIRYPFADGSGEVVIATTRPETLFGDTAVAVNPNDERFKGQVGKDLILPLVNRKIKLIADEYCEMGFGTGAVKITPAHDPNDYEIGLRHNLEVIHCIDDNGLLTESAGSFAGMDRIEARPLIEKALKDGGYLIKKDKYKNQVGTCDRCGSFTEPKISSQWFVKMKDIVKPAIDAVRQGKIKFHPKRYEKTYLNWLENTQDWCISRQIWLGHRIPVYTCENGHTFASEEDKPSCCPKCQSTSLTQENDVLDTWFSSALWPFSTLGYPNKSEDLKYYYPTSTLVTAYDIITFWVSKMVFSGIKFMNDVPFKDVYLHALVRDEKGQKMSKSKGNVIDPLIMIDKYGADAFRFTLAIFAAQGRDIKMNVDRVEGYRNFINKIWNASRFILMNLGDEIPKIDENSLESVDKWILVKLQHAAKKASKAIDTYSINDAANELYQFFWMTFCDWYLELIKDRMFKGSDKEKEQALATAAFVLEKSLIALHPYIPFVTEHIFQTLTGKDTIMYEEYPDNLNYNFEQEEKGIDKVIEAVSLIRNIRGEYNITPAAQLEIFINTDDNNALKLFQAEIPLIMKMGKAKSVQFNEKTPENCAKSVGNGFEIMVSLEGTINVEEEIARLEKEKKAVEKDVNLYGGKLQNQGYLAKAPAQVIEKDKKTYEEAKARLDKINEALAGLKK